MNEDIKRELQDVHSVYAESFARQDAAAIASLFSNGGVHVNETGPRADIEQLYQAIFNAGSSSRIVFDIHEAWSLGTNVATSVGEFRITGKDPNGAMFERVKRMTVAYPREGEKWKIQMATVLPKA